MITKYIEPWILPPGIIVLVLLAILLSLIVIRGMLRRELRAGRAYLPHRGAGLSRPLWILTVAIVVLSLLTGGLLAISTETVSRVLIGRLEGRVPPAAPAELCTAQAVVVLGGGTVIGPRWNRLAPEAEGRLVQGYLVARELALPVVVTGGRVLDDELVPAGSEIAADRLRELGLPREMIIQEPRARTTAENARYTAEDLGFTEVILVTSAWHMRRSMLAFEAVGITAHPVPAPIRADRRPWRPYMLLPSIGALEESTIVMHEALGYLWYRIRL